MTDEERLAAISTRAQRIADAERGTKEWRLDHGWQNYNPPGPKHMALAAVQLEREGTLR